MAHSPAKGGLDIGSVIADTYTIEGLIGKGGMGAVFQASHARLPGKKVAIKILHADVADAESLARFRREAEIASRLGHPNIVEVHDWNSLPDGTPYLVLELLQGEPLSSRLAHGPMPLDQIFLIIRQVGSALAAAHREDIIHRDLKPANIFLIPIEADDGYPSERAKVLDFGISKIRGSTTVKTQDAAILGTPQYMAPEQALGNHAAIDGRTDVFALGAMTYEMICGKGAFAGASIPEVVFKVVYEEPEPLTSRMPGVPAHVAAAVHKAMAKKLEDRFPSVTAFVEALTGSPLTSARRAVAAPPGLGGAPSQAKLSQQDALAQTVGSGDHAAQVLGTDRTMASGSYPGPGPGPTPMPAVAMPAVAMPTGAMSTNPSASAGTITSGAVAVASTVAAPTARSRAGLVLGVVGIAAVAAIAIAIVVTRGNGAGGGAGKGSAAIAGSASPPGSAGPVAAIVTFDAAPAIAPPPIDASAAGAVIAIDAAPAVAIAPAPIDAGAAAVPPHDGHPPHGGKDPGSGHAGSADGATPPDDGGDSDPGIAKLLADAEAALRDGDSDTANKLANRVTSQKPGNPAAWTIKARAACADQDREKAMAALRHLDGRPAFKRRATAACAKLGVTFE